VVAQGDAVEAGESMKLTFTCPECDTLIQESDIAMTEYSGHWGFHDLLTCPKCPQCAKLTYGPLGEDMMKDALRMADRPCRDGAAYIGMARFVLRLLREADENDHLYSGPGGYNPASVNWRQRLLDLARLK